MKKSLFKFTVILSLILSCAFVASAADEESKYEYHDSSWYLSVREAEAFMGFIYDLAPEDLAEKEFADLAIKLLSGQYADSPEDEYIIKMAVCEVALTQMNSRVARYDHASVITSTNLINWLKGQVGENPTEEYANNACNAYLDKIKEGIIKAILLGNTANLEELEITLKIQSCYDSVKTIVDLPKKAESYAKAVKAGIEAVLYAGSSSRSAMYQYFLAYARTRDLANSTIDGFELAMNYNVFALVNQGLYDPFLNWADEDNQKVLNRWAELFYWLTEDVGGIEFVNDNTSGTTSSTLEPVEFVPGTGTAEGKCGDKVKWHLDASTGILNIYGEGAMDNYASASKTPWYGYRQYINYIKVADGVTLIGNYAFAGCSTLDKVYLSVDLNGIGNYAFYNCVALRLFVIDGNVNYIGSYAFANCKSLVYFNIPNTVTHISSGLFDCCINLVYVNLPDGITSIGYQSFYMCGKLTALNLTEGLLSIGEDAFLQCYELTTVGGIPSTVTYIGPDAFANCYKLEDDIIIPSGITMIEEGTFRGCLKVKSIEIPNSVTKIGISAFGSCASITELVIPESVTYLPEHTFSGCESLKELTIPASISMYSFNNINYHTFYGCKNIEKVTLTKGTGTMTLGSQNRYPWGFSKDVLKEVIIEDGVTNIGNEAFYGCSVLKKVELPDSITTIGNSAFYGCINLTEITMPNKTCSIYDSSSTIHSNTIIKAPCGSTVYDYAKKYNRSFVSIEHTLTEWLADFTVNGETMTTSVYKKCVYCDEVVNLTTHTTTGWIVDTEATCTIDGYKHIECLDCGNRYDAVIPATGHTEVVDEAVAANCTETGLTEGKHCSACRTVFIEQTVTKSLGHNMSEWAQSKAPSCTEKGENRSYCSRCEYYETEEIAMLPHTEIVNVAVMATCSATGLTEGKYCSVCNTILIKQTVTDTLSHNLSEYTVVSSATCTENGEQIKQCINCTYAESQTIPATGHTFDGSKCTSCGYDKADECDCNCHASGIKKFFFNFILFFQKLFKKNAVCTCGVAHY